MLEDSRLLTVSELTDRISRAIRKDPELIDVTVAGELSNFVHHRSGHMYFTLKDEDCSIRGVMFQTWNRLLPFTPQDGQYVYLRGDVTVYKRGGNYQFNAYAMEPAGQGALALAFAQLKDKLAKEGLFAQERKRSLPRYPRRIGLVTSPQAAALQDFLVAASQRGWPTTFVLSPAIVQGEAGAASVKAALQRLSKQDVDVIVITRGGGSLEELWVFNEETVARTVAASLVPVVSAIGHETDFTICDFVADARGATPTAAARLVVPDSKRLLGEINQLGQRLTVATMAIARQRRQQLEDLACRPILARPLQILLPPRQNLDMVAYKFRTVFARLLEQRRARVMGLAARLADLNPLAVLRRGYAVIRDEQGIIKSKGQLIPAKLVTIQVWDGQAQARILAAGREGDGTKI